ncbi:MAG: DUF397 domain-containing protein [Umezawaea sp.]
MWRKSTYSGANDNGNCVEVAFTARVAVRDSKNPQAVLSFSSGSFRVFVGLARLSPPLDRGNV